MKAVLVKELGGPEKLVYEEVPTPVPGAGEVLIRVKYAALNRRDVWITYGQYPGMKLPSILGSDGAGEVVAVGEGVEGITVGSHVVINPALNWGDNPDYYGPNFNILGMPTDGTYAQYVKVPAENVFLKPGYLSFEEAAAIPLGGLTAYRALFTRGKVQKGETVFIPGIGGGVALFVLQMAVAAGARVFVTSSSEEKIARAKELGAAGGVNYRSENYTKELRKLMGGGADLIIDSVGGPQFNDFINVANPNGRIVTFGATNGAVPELVLPKIFFKHLNILGSTMGNPQEFKEMLNFIDRYQIHPVIDRRYPLENAYEAQKRMERGENFGKIVLEIPE